jgi:hypothetical protein
MESKPAEPKPAQPKPAEPAKPAVEVVRDEKGIYTLKPADRPPASD